MPGSDFLTELPGVLQKSLPALLLVIAINPAASTGSPASLTSFRRQPPEQGDEQMLFQRQYLGLGYARNFPVSFSNQRFNAGIPHPVITYRYFLNNHWAVGVSGQFKFLTEKATGEELVLATLSQESHYIHRLYYPLFLMTGGRLQYLSPVRKGMFPLQRHSDYQLEIGASASIGLIYKFTPDTVAELKFERWRGTKTMQLHGTELSLGIGFSLPGVSR